MKVNEKITKLEEKILKKEIALEEKKKVVSKLKDEIKAMEKAIESARTEIERLRVVELTELMQSKSISAAALKQAIINGSIMNDNEKTIFTTVSTEGKNTNDISNS